MKKMVCPVVTFVLALLCFTAFGQQGAGRLLYTVPNTTFIESKTGDHAITINDSSGSISSLQTAINNARSANPTNVIVIHLLRGATYTVSSAGLVLSSHECLVGSGALIQAATASVTVPLITIASGSINVSVAGGTLDGNGANINGILAPAAARVNIDKVVVRNCGSDCILLKGNGNTTYDNEMTVTRCDVSGSAAHAGISIQNSTQTAVLDNDCHDNSAGIYLSCAWANVANNTCENNTTGIDAAGGNDNVVANNTCNNNGTGIHVAGTKNMITGNALSANATAGIGSAGSANYFLYNSFGSDGANTANFSNGGTGDGIIAFETPLSASGQNYFYPPLIDNQHTSTIENGMGRTDVTISSTSIASVQSQYNSALSANPNNVIVLHLNGTFTVGSSPLTLQSDTCVLLNGTIQINSSTTAAVAISGASSAARISISGGTIDGGNLSGNAGIEMTSGNSMICLDKITLQNFGDNSTSQPGSDAVHFNGGTSPSMVTRCKINKSGSRGLWASTSNHKILYEDNYVALTRAGIDCDFHTFGAVCMFNTLVNNTYGLWYEQGAQHDTGIGNIVTNSARDNLDAGNLNQAQTTQYNSFLCNVVAGGGYGLINSAGSDGTTFTSHNFFFNNVVMNANNSSDDTGSQNYYSQNYQSGGSLTVGPAATYFNSKDVDGFVQIRDNNSGLAVAVDSASTSSGAAIVTAAGVPQGDASNDDEWKFVPTRSGFYQIVNQNSGLAMVVGGASTTNGAPVIQFAYSSDATYNDEWLIQPIGNGLYNFVNRLSGLNLDVKGASTAIGTQLDQWPDNGAANQQFSLVEDFIGTSATPDYSVTASPSSQTLSSGGSTSYTATITPTNGFGGTVTFSVSGLPTGATGTFSPTSVTGSGSSTLTVSTSSSTPAGSYTLTITGTSGSLSHNDTVILVVSDFSIVATPGSQTTAVGSSANYTVNLGNFNGFSGSINLSATGLPTGASASFSPVSLTAPGSSTLTVTTTSATPAANSTLTLTGTSGATSHSTNVTLKVTDYTLSISPASQSVGAGNSTAYSVTVTALNGFNGTINFGSVSGLPAGATASFSPASITGSGTATLTISTTTSTAIGSYALAFTATSGSLSHNTSFALNVTDFSVSATPASQTIAGGNATYTATVTGLNGFSDTVNWSVSGLPAGTTASFNPASVAGSGNSTLTVVTTSSTPPGTSTLTITGTDGALSHSTTVSLTVTAAPDFTVSATPSSQTVLAGNNTSYTATIGALNGFTGTVNFTVTGLPTGATASFSPASIAGSGSSTLTVTTTSSMAASTNTLTITATSGSLSHTANVTLVVTAAGITWITVNDTSASITYNGSWSYLTNRADGDFNNDVHDSKTNGNYAQFTFTGTGIRYITETHSDEGNVDIYLDGVFQTTVNCNTSNRVAQVVAYANTSLANATHTIKVVKSSGTFLLVDAFAFTTAAATPIALTDRDIGAVGIAGSAGFNNGVYTVTGSGSDIWTAGDQFNYDYRGSTNDVTVQARVSSENGTQGFAKAAVMIRESLATNSIEASVLLTLTNGVAMEVRSTTGTATVNLTGWVTGPVPPTFVKLTRMGSTFTGFYSADGATWTQLAATNVTMNAIATVGLAVTAHSNTNSNTATFSNLAIQ